MHSHLEIDEYQRLHENIREWQIDERLQVKYVVILLRIEGNTSRVTSILSQLISFQF